MDSHCFHDKEMIGDVLSTQKFISGNYNANACESSNTEVKNTFLSLLDDEQAIQHEVFVEMQTRGWYPTESAPQNKIQETKDQFCNGCHHCC